MSWIECLIKQVEVSCCNRLFFNFLPAVNRRIDVLTSRLSMSFEFSKSWGASLPMEENPPSVQLQYIRMTSSNPRIKLKLVKLSKSSTMSLLLWASMPQWVWSLRGRWSLRYLFGYRGHPKVWPSGGGGGKSHLYCGSLPALHMWNNRRSSYTTTHLLWSYNVGKTPASQ